MRKENSGLNTILENSVELKFNSYIFAIGFIDLW